MNNIKIGIASDHRGFTAKEFLKEYFDENDIYVIDFGTNSAESVDFPVYAKKLGEAIQNEEIDLGIAICGTGIGMSIVLNKMKGVYCAKVSNESEAILCKSHNNANVIAMSEEIDHEVMKKIVNNFIETPFDDVLAVICELPLFFISNSSATTLHPLFAGTEIEYSSVGYLSPA